MRFFLFTVFLVLTISPASSQSLRETGEVLFFDDFERGEIDRTIWNVQGPDFWVNNEQQIYVDSVATVEVISGSDLIGAENGVLALRGIFHPGFAAPSGRIADFISGRINSRGKFDFTYGRAEARILLPKGEGVWPAFWLMGNGRWPDIGEIDIMEYVGESDWTGVALHGPGYSGETPLVNKSFFRPPESALEWHVYAVEWREDRIDFYTDDHLTYRATRPMVEHYGPWRFDNPKYLILNVALGGGYPFKTNGVEKPYNGLPVETVELIRQEPAVMYVDWVRVTRLSK